LGRFGLFGVVGIVLSSSCDYSYIHGSRMYITRISHNTYFQNPVCSLNNKWGKTSNNFFLKMTKIAVSGNDE